MCFINHSGGDRTPKNFGPGRNGRHRTCEAQNLVTGKERKGKGKMDFLSHVR